MKELVDLQIMNSKLNSIISSLKIVKEKLNNIEGSKIEYIGDDKLSELEGILISVISNRDLISVNKQYDEDIKKLERMKREEKKELLNNMNIIKENIWVEYEEKECEENINDYIFHK